MENRKVAKVFWNESSEYPSNGIIKERRLHEVNYIVPKLKNAGSLLDLGCGY
jgi:hypothetical protein